MRSVTGSVSVRTTIRKRTFNWAECYAAGLFVFGEFTLMGTVVLLAQRMLAVSVPAWSAITVGIAYASWATTGLYADRGPTVRVRAMIVAATFVAALGSTLYLVLRYRFAGLG